MAEKEPTFHNILDYYHAATTSIPAPNLRCENQSGSMDNFPVIQKLQIVFGKILLILMLLDLVNVVAIKCVFGVGRGWQASAWIPPT